MSNFPYQQVKSLLLIALKEKPIGQFNDIVNTVLRIAIEKDLIQIPGNKSDIYSTSNLDSFLQGNDKTIVRELIRQSMWSLLYKNIIVFGKDEYNGNFPWYRITGYGEKVINEAKPQPYDPDSFLSEFKSVNKNVDPVIYSYLEEAVNSFNHDCPKAASVMLGAASEKAILILYDLFHTKIIDATNKSKFERDSRWTISSKFSVLHDRLKIMVDNKIITGELKEIVLLTLPGVFDLVRRQRNSAGHPEILANIVSDSIFLNLRVFSDYIKSIYKLLDYFTKNDADW